MTPRKFYKTTIKVEILSEEPVSFDDLYGVHLAITDGDCSGDWQVTSVKKLNGRQAVRELSLQGSSPSFFFLSPEGEDENPRL